MLDFFKNVLLVIYSLLFVLNSSSWAANNKVKENKIISRTNTSDLKLIAQKFNHKNKADKIKIQNYLTRTGRSKRHDFSYQKMDKSGKIKKYSGTTELMRLDKNNFPTFYITHNLNAAKTVSTDTVWPGGSGGLNSTGTAINMGLWDAGSALTTHQELIGRIIIGDVVPPETHEHSTHVAGTIIASGVDANAKGMAYAGQLYSFDWNNDVSEMATQAASGLLISNHSYGISCGWHYDSYYTPAWIWYGYPLISETKDYRFGFYNNDSQAYDQIANNAPYYLIVKSAGNDRNDDGPGAGGEHWAWINDTWVVSTTTRDPDGQYDCIGPGGVAKNILCVGAVSDIPDGYAQSTDVIMSSFSTYGPTDDGRIKPDIVANGVNVYSCIDSSDTSYASYSGTSMAAPNATGSLALLQEHYQNTHNSDSMLASVLKALVIHTADEAGTAVGPDYAFGWGLLNTLRASQMISDDVTHPALIQECVLSNNGNFSLTLNSTGSEPLKATIVWNDPAGTPSAVQLNPRTAILVNDLDLRITKNSNGQEYEPWILDIENPANPASTGDNFLDNVEQVYINSPSAGTYTLTINHKGTLSGSSGQTVALIISGTTQIDISTPTPVPTSTPTSTPTPALGDIDLRGKITLPYPNPAKNKMNFLIHLDTPAEVTIGIYNIVGEKIAELGSTLPAGRGQVLTWLCANNTPGIYIARVLVNGEVKGKLKVAIIK